MTRSLRVAIAVGALALPLLTSTPARADGGAYLWFERTYNYPGTTAEAYASVYVPQAKRAILDRGPFYLYVLTGGSSIREGRPMPDGAIRLGTFSIERDRKWFEFEVGFTVPELPGGFYTVAVCNEPCTVAGFREPLVGVLPIVATAREEQLLRQQGRMQGRIGTLHRDLRKAQREVVELEGITDLRSIERTTVLAEADDLRDQVERLRARLARRPRPVVAPASAWAVAVALCVLGLAIAIRRRGRSDRRPDGARPAYPPTGGVAILDPEPEVVRDAAERERAGTR